MAKPASPQNASTVILLRPEAGGGFELFLTRRSPDMDVLGGFYVFPGGTVEESDCSEEMRMRCRGLSPTDAQRILGGGLSPELAIGHSVAAVRELFEETGVLLSASGNGEPVDTGQETTKRRLAGRRESLVEGKIDFRSLLESEGLYCDLSRPVYFFHRVTPEQRAFRFDTRFYLAALPQHQSPLGFSQEVAESLWLTPGQALRRAEADSFPLMPPTLIALKTLAACGSWEKLRAQYGLKS